MKAINHIIVRIFFILLLGAVLIARPLIAINYLVITIGVLFLIPGLVSIFRHFRDKNHSEPNLLLIESIGSCFLGLALILAPSFFISALMYIIAVVLIFSAVLQIRGLFILRKQFNVSVFFYITPVLVLLIGAVILFNPFTIVETAFMVLGIACVIYGLSELVNYLKFLKNKN